MICKLYLVEFTCFKGLVNREIELGSQTAKSGSCSCPAAHPPSVLGNDRAGMRGGEIWKDPQQKTVGFEVIFIFSFFMLSDVGSMSIYCISGKALKLFSFWKRK